MTHLNDHRLATLRQDLHDLYGNTHAAADIDAEVDAAIAATMIAEFLERARVGQTVVGF